MIPDILVFPVEGGYEARDPMAQTPVAKGEDASAVLNSAFAALPSGGGCVGLRSGDYVLSSPVKPKSRSSLVGAGRSSRMVVTATNSEGVGIRLEGVEGVNLREFTVSTEVQGGGKSGIEIEDSGDSRLSGLYVRGFSKHGIALLPGCFLVTVAQCTAAGNGQSGFFGTKNTKTRVGEFVPLLFEGCTAYAGSVGFEMENAIVANFVGCVAYQTLSHGFHFHDHSNSIVVSGCRTFQVGGNALRIDRDTHEIHAVGNIFCWQRDHGVFVQDACWGAIVGNNVIDSGTRTADGTLRHGIVLDGETRGITVSGNSVFNWGDQPFLASGIVEAETCAFNAFVANNLNDTTEKDLLIQGDSSHVADNVSRPEKAYIGMERPPYPDFSVESLQEFLERQ